MVVSEVYRVVTVKDEHNDITYTFEQTQGSACTMRIHKPTYNGTETVVHYVSEQGMSDLIKALTLIQNRIEDKD